MPMIRYGDVNKQPDVVEEDAVPHLHTPSSCPKCGSTNVNISGDGTVVCLGCKGWSAKVAATPRHG